MVPVSPVSSSCLKCTTLQPCGGVGLLASSSGAIRCPVRCPAAPWPLPARCQGHAYSDVTTKVVCRHEQVSWRGKRQNRPRLERQLCTRTLCRAALTRVPGPGLWLEGAARAGLCPVIRDRWAFAPYTFSPAPHPQHGTCWRAKLPSWGHLFSDDSCENLGGRFRTREFD